MSSPTIVVVGAGPAGSTSARILAEAGARVVLIEARRLPRDKTCAGGVTAKARRWLPPAALATVQRSVDAFEFRRTRSRPLRVADEAARIDMVDRTEFDHALATAAAGAGVDVLDGSRVRSIAEDEAGVTVVVDGITIRAHHVIAADGEPSTIARRLGLAGAPPRRSLGLEGRVPLAPDLPVDRVIVSFSVPRGYAWYFPKGDHASIGVGSSTGRPSSTHIRSMRASLAAFARELGIDLADARISGRWLAQGIRRGRLATDRCLLAGDAAGMVDPLFGEGIAYAVGTGALAAHTLLERESGAAEDLTSYERRLHAAYDPIMRRLRFAAHVADRAPSLALTAARLVPWVRAYGVNVISGRRSPFMIEPAG